MGLTTIKDIERAIGALKPDELQELYAWLDQHCPQWLDTRIESDLAAGRLDALIDLAISDDRAGKSRPL